MISDHCMKVDILLISLITASFFNGSKPSAFLDT